MTTTTQRFVTTAAAAASAALAACAPSADARPAHESPARGAAGTATQAAAEAPASGAGASGAGASGASTLGAGAVRFTVAGTGNTARYRVRERLMGRDLDNDAVGETSEVTGAVTVDSAGAIVPGQSKVVVGAGAMKSDSDRRDGYVRNRLLQSEQYPTVTLVPTAARGLPARLPAAGASAGPVTFELVGDLTVRGVTRPTTWRVTARQAGGRVTGTASTRFTFAEFGLTQPRVPVVLSVADTIGLEYDFTLTRDAAAAP